MNGAELLFRQSINASFGIKQLCLKALTSLGRRTSITNSKRISNVLSFSLMKTSFILLEKFHLLLTFSGNYHYQDLKYYNKYNFCFYTDCTDISICLVMHYDGLNFKQYTCERGESRVCIQL